MAFFIFNQDGVEWKDQYEESKAVRLLEMCVCVCVSTERDG